MKSKFINNFQYIINSQIYHNWRQEAKSSYIVLSNNKINTKSYDIKIKMDENLFHTQPLMWGTQNTS